MSRPRRAPLDPDGKRGTAVESAYAWRELALAERQEKMELQETCANLRLVISELKDVVKATEARVTEWQVTAEEWARQSNGERAQRQEETDVLLGAMVLMRREAEGRVKP